MIKLNVALKMYHQIKPVVFHFGHILSQNCFANQSPFFDFDIFLQEKHFIILFLF
jgi:hypothetical protein